VGTASRQVNPRRRGADPCHLERCDGDDCGSHRSRSGV